jgi:hypothetical protein
MGRLEILAAYSIIRLNTESTVCWETLIGSLSLTDPKENKKQNKKSMWGYWPWRARLEQGFPPIQRCHGELVHTAYRPPSTPQFSMSQSELHRTAGLTWEVRARGAVFLVCLGDETVQSSSNKRNSHISLRTVAKTKTKKRSMQSYYGGDPSRTGFSGIFMCH